MNKSSLKYTISTMLVKSRVLYYTALLFKDACFDNLQRFETSVFKFNGNLIILGKRKKEVTVTPFTIFFE